MGKRGYSSTTLIGRKDLRHTHTWETWWYSEKKDLMVRMCHVCGDHEEKPKVEVKEGTPRKPRAPRKPRVRTPR